MDMAHRPTESVQSSVLKRDNSLSDAACGMQRQQYLRENERKATISRSIDVTISRSIDVTTRGFIDIRVSIGCYLGYGTVDYRCYLSVQSRQSIIMIYLIVVELLSVRFQAFVDVFDFQFHGFLEDLFLGVLEIVEVVDGAVETGKIIVVNGGDLSILQMDERLNDDR